MLKFALPLFVALSGCCATHTEITIPPRPVLIEWSEGLLERTPLEAVDVCSANDLALKEYTRKLERRVELHNEMME